MSDLNPVRSDVFKTNIWPVLSGSLITGVTLSMIELLSRTVLTISNPAPIYLTAVVYATFSGGFISGIFSAIMTQLYALYFFSIPTQLEYTDDNIQWILNIVTIPTLVVMVGLLKQRAERALRLQLANKILKEQIAERQQVEAQLRKANERFQLAAAAVKGIIYDYDLENNYVERTKGITEVLGYHPEDVEPSVEWWRERIHPDDLPQAKSQFSGILSNQSTYTIEYRIRSQDNQYLNVWDRGVIVRAEDGRAVRVVGFTLDITDRKRTEAALQESEDRCRRLVELSPDTIFVQSEGKFVFINSAGLKLLGAADPAQLLGKPILDFIHPENHQLVQERMQQLTTGETLPLVEEKFIRLDNTAVDVEVAASPFTYQGKPAVQVVVRDISERKRMQALQAQLVTSLKESEERFRVAAQSATDLIYEWDLEKGTLEWFGKIDEQLGYEKGEFPRTLSAWKNALHPDDYDRIVAALDLHWHSQEPFFEEYRVRSKDGSYLHWTDRGSALWDETGKPYKIIGVITNITERKSYEIRIRRLFEANIIGIVFADFSGNILAANDAFLQIIGYTRQQVVDKEVCWGEITPPEYASVDENAIAQARATGVCTPFEKEYIRSDGSRVRILVGLALLEGSQDDCVAFVLDLTERQRAQEEREQLLVREQEARESAEASEQLYRFLAESIPQFVWTAQPNGYNDYLNQRWLDYTGLTLDESKGWGWMNIVHPQDRQGCLGRWNHALATGEIYETECRYKRAADQSYRWHLVRGVPMRDKSGQIIKWFGTCTDIDQQKRTEQALLFLSEGSTLLASSIDYQTTLSQLAHLAVPHLADYCLVHTLEENESLRQVAIAHVNPHQEELWLEMQRLYPLNPNLPYGIHQVFRTGESELYSEISELHLKMIAQNTEHLRFLENFKSMMVVPLVARGRTLGVLSFITAESNRHYDSEDLAFAEELAHRAALAVDNARLYRVSEAARKEAQDANCMKDEFLATLSHELRTPLNSILGWSKLLRSRKFDEGTTVRALETIERNAQLQTQLIEDILEVSRIIQGQLRLQLSPVILIPVIKAAIEVVRPTAEAKAIQLEFQSRCEIALVSADANRLQQIIWNLLSNAIKFTPQGGRVTIQLSCTGFNAQIQVIDTGIGIGTEFLPYVFDRFRQADSSSTRAHGGLGLGLAIVRHLVELHGGTVSVESSGTDKGSTFTVQLPLLRRSEELGAKIEELKNSLTQTSIQDESYCYPTPDSLSLSGLQVLIVDDEPDAREFILTVLQEEGAKVVASGSVQEALEVLEGWQPDVLISDIAMPIENGYVLIHKVRTVMGEQKKQLKAIALSAYVRPEDQQQSLAAGFQMHVAKPVEPSHLVAVVAQLTGRFNSAEGEGV